MPILTKLREFLDQNQVDYTHTVHPLAYTAPEKAEVAGAATAMRRRMTPIRSSIDCCMRAT